MVHADKFRSRWQDGRGCCSHSRDGEKPRDDEISVIGREASRGCGECPVKTFSGSSSRPARFQKWMWTESIEQALVQASSKLCAEVSMPRDSEMLC